MSISQGTNITINVGKGGSVSSQGGDSSISFTNYNAIAKGGYKNNGDSIINNITISGFKSGGMINNSLSCPYTSCTLGYERPPIRYCKTDYQAMNASCTQANGGGAGAGENGKNANCNASCDGKSSISGGGGGIGKQWSTCYSPTLKNFYWGGGGSPNSTGGLGGGGGINPNGGNTDKSTVFSGDIGSVNGGANTGGGGGGTTGIGGDGIVILIFYRIDTFLFKNRTDSI